MCDVCCNFLSDGCARECILNTKTGENIEHGCVVCLRVPFLVGFERETKSKKGTLKTGVFFVFDFKRWRYGYG